MRRRPTRLPLMDASFLQVETPDAPTHVASLQVFELPPDAPATFVRSVVERLRSPAVLARPWNLVLSPSPMSRWMPAVMEADRIDLSYHVRHSALPAPGGERELGELVSHLHGQLLDRTRPLWTCHVIEGLERNRFALYCKMHHALVDGISAMHLMTRCLGDVPGRDNWQAPWAHRSTVPRPEKGPAPRPRADALKTALDSVRWTPRAFAPLLRRRAGAEPVRRPFEAPRSVLNGPVDGARRVATQRFELDRIRRLATAADASVNDIFLALCGTAVRRHLMESDDLPDTSLITGVPVSLRARDAQDREPGNAVGFVWASLGTDEADPVERLRTIQRSMNASKAHLKQLPASVRMPFTMATMIPAIGLLVSGLSPRFRPPMNLVISNVPGPDRPLWMGGARMEAMYPVSVLLQGLGLNITCVSYAGQLTVGFTGCRDGIPHLQRIAVRAMEALEELEAVFLANRAPRPTPAPKVERVHA